MNPYFQLDYLKKLFSNDDNLKNWHPVKTSSLIGGGDHLVRHYRFAYMCSEDFSTERSNYGITLSALEALNSLNNKDGGDSIEEWWYDLSREYVFFSLRGKYQEDLFPFQLAHFIIPSSMFNAYGGSAFFTEEKRVEEMERPSSLMISAIADQFSLGVLDKSEIDSDKLAYRVFKNFFRNGRSLRDIVERKKKGEELEIDYVVVPEGVMAMKGEHYIYFRTILNDNESVIPDIIISKVLKGKIKGSECFDPLVYRRYADTIIYTKLRKPDDLLEAGILGQMRKNFLIVEVVNDSSYNEDWVFISTVQESDLLNGMSPSIISAPFVAMRGDVFISLGNEL